MYEDSGSVVPAQVDESADTGYEQPTGAAELKIFFMPPSREGKRGWIAALASCLRRGTSRAQHSRDHR